MPNNDKAIKLLLNKRHQQRKLEENRSKKISKRKVGITEKKKRETSEFRKKTDKKIKRGERNFRKTMANIIGHCEKSKK